MIELPLGWTSTSYEGTGAAPKRRAPTAASRAGRMTVAVARGRSPARDLVLPLGWAGNAYRPAVERRSR